MLGILLVYDILLDTETVVDGRKKKRESNNILTGRTNTFRISDFKMEFGIRNDLEDGKNEDSCIMQSHPTWGLYEQLWVSTRSSINRWEMCGRKVVV